MMAAGEIVSLPLADIAEGSHVGLVDAAWVSCLASRLHREGQATPIGVRRNGNRAATAWTLVFGRHRMMAAAQLGWTHIDARQVLDADAGPEDVARLQAAENLDRRVMRPIERALFVATRWAEIAEEVHPETAPNQQTRAIRARWAVSALSGGQRADVFATVANARQVDPLAAKACGCSDRSIQRYRRIYTGIVARFPDLFASLNARPAAESLAGITALAEHKDEARVRAAIEMVIADDQIAIGQALVAAGCQADTGRREVGEANQREARFSGEWKKMKPAERESAYVQQLNFTSYDEMKMMARHLRNRGVEA